MEKESYLFMVYKIYFNVDNEENILRINWKLNIYIYFKLMKIIKDKDYCCKILRILFYWLIRI